MKPRSPKVCPGGIGDFSAPLLCTKDLARLMGLSTRRVKFWWKRLRVPPLIGYNSVHRWTRQQSRVLVRRWRAAWKRKGEASAEEASDKYAGRWRGPHPRRAS